MTPRRAAAAAFAVAVALACPAAAQQARRPLSLDMYLEWESVQDPQLSPDGRQIVYTRSFVDPVNDRSQAALWIMNADGSRNRFLVDGSSPRWSPDGTRIAFLAPGNPRGRQIFVRWMDDEGAVSQVTRGLEAPSELEWSPDGRSIAFVTLVPEPLDRFWQLNLPGRPEGARWTAPPLIEDRLNYRRDGVGWTPRGFQHLFVVSADGGTPRQVTQGSFQPTSRTQTRESAGVTMARWMPDGRSMVFVSLLVDEAQYTWRESTVYSVDVASGAVRQLLDRRGPFENPVPSPDGRLIAFQGYEWTDAHYRENELYVMNRDGSNVRTIARELGQVLDNVIWAPDGSGLYFNASMKGAQNVWFAPLSGEPRAVTTGAHMLGMSTNAGILAVGTRSAPQLPGSIVTFDLKRGDEVRTLYFANATLLRDTKLGDVEELWYRSVGDLDVQGWIVKPPDFDPAKRYPLMLQIHGCARGMYNFGFDFGAQEHAANGYVVLYTNPRGSSGYGSRFGDEVYQAFPGKDYDDLIAGVDTLIGRGYVDERNLFVQGASGGGILTAWIVGHTNKFTAAVARSMVADWVSWVGTVDDTRWYFETFAKLPWEDPSGHLERSPLMYAGNVTTPTMVMTGELDLTAPISQAEEFYRALKIRKVPTAMVRLTDSYHNQGARPSNFMRGQLYMRNWFERFMVGEKPATNGAMQQARLEGFDGRRDSAVTRTLADDLASMDAGPTRTECVAQ
jgi:dipeptidyl aminopeptidase/acylaminoacyl peptidase